MTTAVVIQARTRSTRLPGKVLLPLAGAPLLRRMVERVQAARPRRPFALVVATTVEPSDDPIAALCAELGVRCYRGHPTDLLDRHLGAARAVSASAVAKIPSDCPLIDPQAIALVLDRWEQTRGRLDYLGNLHPPSWPDGNDVEVMSVDALATADREARAPHEREHTTPFLWDQPERFRVGNVTWPTGRDLSMTHRLTIDYPADYGLIRAVYDALWSEAGEPFPLEAILAFLDANPAVARLNAAYAGVNWYRRHLDALRTVPSHWTRHEPAPEGDPP
jgi:spore coat polysaccharide biosynthesis protein SpsF